MLDAEAHDLFAVDNEIESLKYAKDDRRFMNKRALYRAQGFLMAYDLIKWVHNFWARISSNVTSFSNMNNFFSEDWRPRLRLKKLQNQHPKN